MNEYLKQRERKRFIKKWGVIAVVIALAFYWFSFREYLVKRECFYKHSIESKSGGMRWLNDEFYKRCLTSHSI